MKEIMVSLFSGIVGVLLTIGYQHYFAPSQPYTVLYNGEEINVVESDYLELTESYNALEAKFITLQDKYNQLQTLYENTSYTASTYDLLQEENNQLKADILQSQNKINDLQNEIDRLTELINRPEPTIADFPDSNGTINKVSIFNMSTFQGIGGWYDRSHPTLNNSNFIDTYDNEYLSAYVGSHNIRTINSNTIPIYLLESNYSKCEGQFAWPKNRKNSDGSIWIEFYSDDILLYQTEAITATDKAVSFEFSVQGVEKLTIVRNGTIKGLNAIYPYLNLIP